MASDYAHTDRISGLPDNLIDNIMQFLSLLDAARMSILSKNWRSNWLSLPQLVFDSAFANTCGVSKWSSTISNILFNHEGPIIKFTLFIPGLRRLLPHVTAWISFVSRNGLQSLVIESYGHLPISLPSCFFSCAGLKNLKLQGRIVGFPPYCTGFRNLLSLCLEDIELKVGVFTGFLSCSPFLESLQLMACTLHGPLIINLPNLKNLFIHGNYESIIFKNAPSLLEFALNFADVVIIEGVVEMIKFLSSSCKMRMLCLDGYTFKVWANSGMLEVLPTTFQHLKVLELMNVHPDHVGDFLCVSGVVRSCRNMEELFIWLDQRSLDAEICEEYDENEMDALELEQFYDDGECRFNHLRSITIDNIIMNSNSEMKLITYLLAFSPSLKRLSFSCDPLLGAAQQLKLCSMMQQFERASPGARVVNRKG